MGNKTDMKIFGVTGWKNAGKTGLMERLVSEITSRGFAVSTLKHAHHVFDVDHPGKDSHRHREAGAKEVLVSSRRRWALMSETRHEDEPPLSALLGKMKPVDLVLIEGWKRESHPKVEAWRAETAHPLIAPNDPLIKLVASDTPIDAPVPVVDLNDTGQIADFILNAVGLGEDEKPPHLAPPPLRDDCFALPPGVDWLPVDDALARLRKSLTSVVSQSKVPVSDGLGRVLTTDITARRSNPPGANTAVDGFGFTHSATGAGPQELPLVDGRAAAGAPYTDPVPHGSAIRILTGALLPPGVDTVVLEEDTTSDGAHVAFNGPVKPGANTRKAGEDVKQGDTLLPAGRKLTPADLALLSATGNREVDVFRNLRVGVLSTGDELGAPGEIQSPPSVTYDANRPMLMAMLTAMGFDPVDLGHVADDRHALAKQLDDGAARTDAILTSGGASAGDEDHVSALLSETGSLNSWRIAVKPGRPLALANWQGTPVFGLPGNPVAAFVCTAIFARPALKTLSGEGWAEPVGFTVPAAFSKNKKQGRREYLRARLNDDGYAEVFHSEGSGRISGLSWATGLVELGDDARQINPGDPVRFVPFASFDL